MIFFNQPSALKWAHFIEDIMTDQIHAALRLHKKHNPIVSAELERRFELSGASIRDAIRELRRKGFPIASSNSGYFYADNYLELEPTITDLEGRALSQLETVKLMKKNFDNQQLTLY